MTRTFEAVASSGIIVLPTDAPRSARCMVTILEDDIETLKRQAAFTVSKAKQQRMRELLLKNRDGELTRDEEAEMDAIAAECETTTLAKIRALHILAQLGHPPQDS